MSDLPSNGKSLDFCRICVVKPEADNNLKFVLVFGPDGDNSTELMISEFLDTKINRNDGKPKIICITCYDKLVEWKTFTKKAREAQYVINYLDRKFKDTYNGLKPKTSVTSSLDSSNNYESRNEELLLLQSKKKIINTINSTANFFCPEFEDRNKDLKPKTSVTSLLDSRNNNESRNETSPLLQPRNKLRTTFNSRSTFFCSESEDRNNGLKPKTSVTSLLNSRNSNETRNETRPLPQSKNKLRTTFDSRSTFFCSEFKDRNNGLKPKTSGTSSLDSSKNNELRNESHLILQPKNKLRTTFNSRSTFFCSELEERNNGLKPKTSVTSSLDLSKNNELRNESHPLLQSKNKLRTTFNSRSTFFGSEFEDRNNGLKPKTSVTSSLDSSKNNELRNESHPLLQPKKKLRTTFNSRSTFF